MGCREQSSQCWCAVSCLTPPARTAALTQRREGGREAGCLGAGTSLQWFRRKKNKIYERSQNRVWDLGLKVLDFNGLMTHRVWLCWGGLCRTSKCSPPQHCSVPQNETAAGQSTATASHWYTHSTAVFLPIPDKSPMYYPSRTYKFTFFGILITTLLNVKLNFCQISGSSRL